MSWAPAFLINGWGWAEHRPLGLDLFQPVPEDNPLTPEKVKLGRRLFRDRLLSRDRSTACADCHRPKLAFTDGRAKAVGVYGRQGPRSVPTLINRAWGKSFFRDGRIPTLEKQVVQPILAESEMDLTLEEAVARLRSKRRYRKAFVIASVKSPTLPTLLLPWRPMCGRFKRGICLTTGTPREITTPSQPNNSRD